MSSFALFEKRTILSLCYPLPDTLPRCIQYLVQVTALRLTIALLAADFRRLCYVLFNWLLPDEMMCSVLGNKRRSYFLFSGARKPTIPLTSKLKVTSKKMINFGSTLVITMNKI